MIPESMKAASQPSRRGPVMVLAAVATLLLLYVVLPSAPSATVANDAGLRATSAVTSIQHRSRIAIITDLDKRSLVTSSKKPKWRAILKRGWLNFDATKQAYNVEWTDETELISGHGEAGRGMELSELIMWEGRLYTVDDRSGIVFEILDFGGSNPSVVPRYILMEGNGNTDKGFKGEWMTVKDGELVVSSFGKEYANSDGTIKNKNNNWIATIDKNGHKTYIDWTAQYEAMRQHADYVYPSYILHEAGMWSDKLQKWVFIPRRMSKEAYDEDLDEKMGANTIFVASADFSKIHTTTVGHITPERGFSTGKFVPGSGDRHIIAIKSAENGELNTQTSYITVFSLDGRELMPETEIPGNMKYEGLEFI